MTTIHKGFYRHWKGGVYFVHGIAVMDSLFANAIGITLVLYESIQGCNVEPQAMRARTLEDFTAEVQDRDGHSIPRFERIESW